MTSGGDTGRSVIVTPLADVRTPGGSSGDAYADNGFRVTQWRELGPQISLALRNLVRAPARSGLSAVRIVELASADMDGVHQSARGASSAFCWALSGMNRRSLPLVCWRTRRSTN